MLEFDKKGSTIRKFWNYVGGLAETMYGKFVVAFSYFDLGLQNALNPGKERPVFHSKQKAFADVLEIVIFKHFSGVKPPDPQTPIVFSYSVHAYLALLQ